MIKINYKSFGLLAGIFLFSCVGDLFASETHNLTVGCINQGTCDSETFKAYVREVLNADRSIDQLMQHVANKHAEDSNNTDSNGFERSYFYIKKNKVNKIFINELRGRLLLAAEEVTPGTNIIYNTQPSGERFIIKMEVVVDPGEHLLAHITSGDGQHLGVGNNGATNKIAFWIVVNGVSSKGDVIKASDSTAWATFPRS